MFFFSLFEANFGDCCTVKKGKLLVILKNTAVEFDRQSGADIKKIAGNVATIVICGLL